MQYQIKNVEIMLINKLDNDTIKLIRRKEQIVNER